MQTVSQIQPSPRGRSYLRDASFLRQLDEETFEHVYQQFEWLQVDADQWLFDQGSTGDSLYVLVSGRLGAFVRQPGARPGSTRLISEIHPGECVGEMSVLTGEARAARVIALRQSVVVRLSRDQFCRLLERHPETLSAMNEVLIQRIHNRYGQAVREPSRARVFGVLPLLPGLSTHDFCCALTRELSHWARVLHLCHRNLEERAGTGDIETHIGARRLAHWIQRQERYFDHVLLEDDDAEPSNWEAFCASHCDQLLLIADATCPPNERAEVFRRVQRNTFCTRQRHLILVHPDSASQPIKTARWLDALRIDHHYNIRIGHRADVKRLARFLTGNAVTLALAGGGALGMAHIGVLQALEEHRVPVDLACGASSGATIAAQCARGDRAEVICRQTKAAIPKHVFFDLKLPVVSLLRTQSLENGLNGLFGDQCAEDLWQRFFCVASNLTRARVELLDRGALRDQILASGALPGFFPPQVNHHGDLLADGAVLDNLPLAHAARYGSGKQIAVNVIPTLDKQMCRGLPPKRSSVRLLWDRITTPSHEYPNLVDIGLRGLFLKGVIDAERIRRSADLYIEPPLEQFSFTNMGAFDQIVRLGYYAASAALDRWIERDESVQRTIAINEA